MEALIKKFSAIHMADVPEVGGKNASLGEMITTLTAKGIHVPDGFATTAAAFRLFLEYNGLAVRLQQLMQQLDRTGFSNLQATGAAARSLILQGRMPHEVHTSIVNAYRALCGSSEKVPVAVRSSATAEDMPQASFAGQHESYLNIAGEAAVVDAVHRCFASLYTDRAIKYREDNGFEHSKVLLSAGIQKMVRSDLACSGVGFTLEPESGFRNVVLLSGVWGLGENIVQGAVMPDEFYVFKPSLAHHKKATIQKKLGEKAQTMVYTNDPEAGASTVNKPTSPEMRDRFVLSDAEVTQLAQWCVLIEEHYQRPMDIEWAKDGTSGKLFILQARPETIHARAQAREHAIYTLQEKGRCLVQGAAIGSKVAAGIARILASPAEAGQLQEGEIVVTGSTSPDWDPVLKKVAAIVTDTGGRTSHASIVARELGIPAIVGAQDATKKIRNGDMITVSCCEGKTGYVYEGRLAYTKTDTALSNLPMPRYTAPMLIMSDPDMAFALSFYPNRGVGLLRMEFIITRTIGIHPMALVNFDQLQNKAVRDRIAYLTRHYTDKKAFFIDKLSQGIATIAAAFYPKEVIVRMSDFKSNEYAELLGGKGFEPKEENPMLGFRGASRYYHPLYKEGFGLECAAVKTVRDEMGLTNVKVMIPFCRTLEEGKKVLEVMRSFGLPQHENGLQVYVMAELPANVLEAAAFAEHFDGFSIGSNDLTQLTLGIDRDSALVAPLFNEEDAAAKKMITMVLDTVRNTVVPIGFCGQAPSDLPDFAAFLVAHGINSISFNPDALLPGIANILKAEKEQFIDNEPLPVII
ncbi:MAG TPA: phosphoenolpyruvate synthase [Chitinophaga sp.]|uniref:phosphoenolpyruvate synthase n=1 Tax=Chitinophaga sp. TaxID=1869181 RepID=UPI002DBE4094|nr:phosphoenolpyruvate synthase [Chitinophaga sp.]HEU4555602.1 phosphoenolpyruvate synthase [Chitinophaga sp.]